MEPNLVSPFESQLEAFRLPKGALALAQERLANVVNVNSIVAVASHTFTFRENSNTPGRLLDQSVVVNVPDGAGFFTCIPHFTGAFTTGDFQRLTERPLGQLYVSVGLRGNNFVCHVRLTDSNSDDPIFIQVTGVVVFYR